MPGERTERSLAPSSSSPSVPAVAVLALVGTGFDYLGEPTPYNSDATNLLNFSDPEERARGASEIEQLAAQAGELLLAPCRREARRIVLAEGTRQTPIVPAELGIHAAAVGAADHARIAAFAFKGLDQDVRSIGAKLATGSLVEGSVRQASLDDYTSHNTERLDLPGVRELLLGLPGIRAQLGLPEDAS